MRVIDARNAYVMTDLLQEVTRSGTAARAQGTNFVQKTHCQHGVKAPRDARMQPTALGRFE